MNVHINESYFTYNYLDININLLMLLIAFVVLFFLLSVNLLTFLFHSLANLLKRELKGKPTQEQNKAYCAGHFIESYLFINFVNEQCALSQLWWSPTMLLVLNTWKLYLTNWKAKLISLTYFSWLWNGRNKYNITYKYVFLHSHTFVCLIDFLQNTL